MNKILIESQEGGLYSTPPALSMISVLSSAASQSIQNVQTLQRFLSPLYHWEVSNVLGTGTYVYIILVKVASTAVVSKFLYAYLFMCNDDAD